MIYGNGGMFGGMYGGGYQSPGWGQRYGGDQAFMRPRGGLQYQPTGGDMAMGSALNNPYFGRRSPMADAPYKSVDMGGGAQGYVPQTGGGWQGQGFTGNSRIGGMFGGYQRAQPFDPYNPQPQGAALADYANRNVMQFANYGQPQASPQMSQEFAYQPKGGLVSAPVDGNSAPGFMMNQTAAPAPQAPPQQSFEQFAATLGNNGMTSGQMQDAYQKSLQPASTNFWANTGVGTQKPAGFVTPPQWGTQTYGFDPRAMAGKQVTGDLGWYYGRDAIGRTINNQGDAVAGFTGPADGFQRTRPWFA